MYSTAGPRLTYRELWSRLYGAGKLKAPVACDSCQSKKRRCQVANLEHPACTPCCATAKRCRCCKTCVDSQTTCVWKYPALTEAAESPFAMQDLEMRNTPKPHSEPGNRRRLANREYELVSNTASPKTSPPGPSNTYLFPLSSSPATTDGTVEPTWGPGVYHHSLISPRQSVMEVIPTHSLGPPTIVMQYGDGSRAHPIQTEGSWAITDLRLSNEANVDFMGSTLPTSQISPSPVHPSTTHAFTMGQVQAPFPTFTAGDDFTQAMIGPHTNDVDWHHFERQGYNSQRNTDWQVINQPHYNPNGEEWQSPQPADLTSSRLPSNLPVEPPGWAGQEMPDAALNNIFHLFESTSSDSPDGSLA